MPPPAAETYEPVVEPGALAPHVWIEPGVALYDLLGDGLTVLDTAGDAATVDRLVAAAEASGTPLTLLQFTTEPVTGVYGSTVVLIRPDAHIAWRGAVATRQEADRLLDRITGRAERRLGAVPGGGPSTDPSQVRVASSG